MTSVGGGIQRNVLEDIRSAGGLNEILVSSAFAGQTGGAGGGHGGVVTDGAAETIQAVPGVIAVLPEIVLPFGAVQLTYDDLTAQPLVVGVHPEQMAPYGFTASEGTVGPAPGQVVLGAGVADRFFDANRQRATPPDLFGQPVTLGAQRFNASAAQAPPAAPGFGAPQAPP